MVLENKKNKDKTTQKNKTENITIGAKKITNFKKITQSKKKKKKLEQEINGSNSL